MIKKIISLIIAIVIVNLSTSNLDFSAQAKNSFELYINDIVAGQKVNVVSSKIEGEDDFILGLLTPSERLFEFKVETEDELLNFEIPSNFLTESGEYLVSIKPEKQNFYSYSIFNFTVFPSNPSNKSFLYRDSYVVKYGETVEFDFNVLDEFGNPAFDRTIVLLKENDDGGMERVSTVSTDNNGVVTFKLSRFDDGLNSYFFYDLDRKFLFDAHLRVLLEYDLGLEQKSVSSTTLSEDFENNTYSKANRSFTNKGSNTEKQSDLYSSYSISEAIVSNDFESNNSLSLSLPKDVGASAGPIDRLEFENVPQTAVVGTPVTFDLSSYDALDQLTTGYMGTVRFSVLGDNANSVSLPSDYTFVPEDIGSHTFTQAVTFQQPGNYVLEARDLDDNEIFATTLIDVSQNQNNSGSDSGIIIENPLAGSFSNNIQVISGTADPGSRLKILDNEIEIASLIADVDGNFTFTTTPLSDGTHVFTVVEVNDIGTILDSSEETTIVIDTSAPEVSTVRVLPEGDLVVDTRFSVEVVSADDLSKVEVELDGDFYELDFSEGKYIGEVLTPLEPGNYSLSITLTDSLGNESNLNDYTTINVIGSENENVEDVVYVAPVENLIASPTDGGINLTWNPVEAAVNPIIFYRVYFGSSPDVLDMAIDTVTNANTWFVPNLVNDQTYYFAVVAIDELGNPSVELSSVVSATPFAEVVNVNPPDVENGIAGSEMLEELEEDPSDAGPALYAQIILAISMLTIRFYKKFNYKRQI